MNLRFVLFGILIVVFTSCEKTNPNAPNGLLIHEIKVVKYPEFDGSDAWDDPLFGATTKPDPYLIVFADDTVASAYFNDQANEELLYTFSPPIRISTPEDQHYIQLWDKDDLNWSDSGSLDDFMDGLTFIPWQIEGDEKKTGLELENSLVRFEVEVEFY